MGKRDGKIYRRGSLKKRVSTSLISFSKYGRHLSFLLHPTLFFISVWPFYLCALSHRHHHVPSISLYVTSHRGEKGRNASDREREREKKKKKVPNPSPSHTLFAAAIHPPVVGNHP